jgi:N-acyl amino acid synthase of PEP-CTERM/exosortase system
MEDVFRLRYRVYCEEKNFLPAEDYPQGFESDEFDENAVHFIVYGDDLLPVGYMRIIDGHDGYGFPMIAHGMTVDDAFSFPPREGAMEISRMIVRADYRHEHRPANDEHSTSTLPLPNAKNASDLVQFRLLRMMYQHALREGAGWICAAMEPTLHRKFRMMGLPFAQIGPAGEYFGEVRPYAMNLREMEAVMEERFPRTMAFFDSPANDPTSRVVRPGEWKVPAISHAA